MERNKTVIACIPYYKGRRYIRRSVLSLLQQTHKEIIVIVVNDGDFASSPWPVLSDIIDPRLIRFDLAANHGGPFYANSVVLNAIDAGYFLIQEQDDWSEPDRVEELLNILISNKADIATSGHLFHTENRRGLRKCIGERWHNPINTRCASCTSQLACRRCFVDNRLTGLYKHRAPHTSLFKTDILRAVGGYYCGFDLHYDTLIMNLVMAVGRIIHTPRPLYNRSMRADSLTGLAESGQLSVRSKSEHADMRILYDRVFQAYQEYLSGEISARQLIAVIGSFTYSRLPVDRLDSLLKESEKLKQFLFNQVTI